jgi:hypothetical protein
MNLKRPLINCQISCFKTVGDGIVNHPQMPIATKIKLNIRRQLNPKLERTTKAYTDKKINWLKRIMGLKTKPSILQTNGFEKLQPGDIVQVRPLQEIEATLNHWRQIKGCAFMGEMAAFCGTTQKVFKRVEQFVDERDLRLKRSNGLIFLENVLCNGTLGFGVCDRACFHFWREEWLQKSDGSSAQIMDIREPKSQECEWVQVRSRENIEKTLDSCKQLKGCTFMSEMLKYCGTKQKILKRVERYFDEADLQAKRTSGIVLLSGVICEGIDDICHCDRACFYLWREEWLKQI